MLTQLRLVSPPALPAVDLALLARHARIDNDAELDLLAVYRDAATSVVEKYLGRSLLPQTLRWTVSQQFGNSANGSSLWIGSLLPLDANWDARLAGGSIIELPYSPVSSVVSVAAGEWGASDTTLVAGTDYDLDINTDPARLRLSQGWSWGSYNHLSVTYVAGYPDAASVPQPIRNGIMLLATAMYEHRGDDDSQGSMSRAVRSLLSPYRLVTFGR